MSKKALKRGQQKKRKDTKRVSKKFSDVAEETVVPVEHKERNKTETLALRSKRSKKFPNQNHS